MSLCWTCCILSISFLYFGSPELDMGSTYGLTYYVEEVLIFLALLALPIWIQPGVLLAFFGDRAHWWLMCNLSLPIHQEPQVLFSSFSKLSPSHLVPSCLLGVFLPRCRTLHLSLLDFIKPSSPFLQPAKVSPNSSPALKGPFSSIWCHLQAWWKCFPSPATYW